MAEHNGMDLGRAYVKIMPSAEGIAGKIKRALGGDVADAGKSSGNGFGQNLVSTFKNVIAAAGIGAAIKSSISEGMELEQNLGGTEAVFGDFADSIKAAANDAYKSMGMSASEYMATANKMGSLFQGSGLEQQQALDLTTQAMQRAADVASVMGIDTEAAMESIAGAAKGNFTMMDNLGVAMNATTLEAYALEKGVNFKWKTASNAEKAQLAMQMFMERTSQYEGNFARESEQTLSGSLGAMQSAFKNVLGNLAVGEDVVPALQSLLGTACSFLMNNLLPAVGNILSGLPSIVGTLAQNIMAHLPELLPAVQQLISSFGSFVNENLPGILAAGVGFVQDFVAGILNGLPDLLPAVQQLIRSFGSFVNENLPGILAAGVGFVHDFVTGILNGLPDFLARLPQIISAFLGFIALNLPQILQAGWDILTELFNGIVKAIPMLLEAAPKIFEAIDAGLTSIRDGLLNVGRNIVEGIMSGISAAGGWLMEQVSGFFQGIVDGAKSLLGIHSPSTVFAGIGKNIALGLGNGIRDGKGPVENAVKELVSTMDTGRLTVDMAATLRGRPTAADYHPTDGNIGGSRQVIVQAGAIVVNAAPGQDVKKIADAVMERIDRSILQKEAAYA